MGARSFGMVMTVAGLAAVVFAVLLVGLTKEDGGVDWISVITATAGVILAGTGLYRTFRHAGSDTPHGPTPHGAS